MQTVYQLVPETDEANAWVKENVNYEPYQKLGNTLVVEHHYIEDIIAGMIDAGFTLGEDFSVR